eukprot:758931-Hanusia_phi.AAC.5
MATHELEHPMRILPAQTEGAAVLSRAELSCECNGVEEGVAGDDVERDAGGKHVLEDADACRDEVSSFLEGLGGAGLGEDAEVAGVG